MRENLCDTIGSYLVNTKKEKKNDICDGLNCNTTLSNEIMCPSLSKIILALFYSSLK